MPITLADLADPQFYARYRAELLARRPHCPKCGLVIEEHLDDPWEVLVVDGNFFHRDCAIDFDRLGKLVEQGHVVDINIELPHNRPV